MNIFSMFAMDLENQYLSYSLVGAATLFSYYIYQRQKKSHPDFVRLSGFPLIGNVLDYLPTTMPTTFVEFPKKYGDLIELYILNNHNYIITDVSVAKEILTKRPKKLSRFKALNYARDIMHLEGGLFNASQGRWNRIRKLTAPSFNNLNIVNKYQNILEQLDYWVDRLYSKLEGKSADSKGFINADMKFESFSLTIRVITVVAFGLSVDNPILDYFYSRDFLNDIFDMFAFMIESAIFPLPYWVWKLTSYFSIEKKGVQAHKRFYESCQRVIDYKRELLASNGHPSTPSMIDSMLSKDKNVTSNENQLDDSELIANVQTYYLAGSETTSVAITWMSYFLSLNRDIQAKVREEVDSLLFRNITSSKDITIEQTSRLKYCIAVFKETLRLRGPAINLAFEVEDDPVTLSNGLTLYPKDLVWVNLDGIHLKSPPFEDPDVFNPDRWLISDNSLLVEMENHLVAFGHGPRLCPGMNLAYQEAVLGLAFLIHYFDVSLNCPKEEIVRLMNFAAAPNKMPIRMTPLYDHR